MKTKNIVIAGMLVFAALFCAPQSILAQSVEELLAPEPAPTAPQPEQPVPAPPEVTPPVEAPPPPPIKTYTPKQLEEKAGFADYCAKDAYLSRTYDCVCMADEYIDKRVELGDAADSAAIINAINQECLFEKSETITLPPGSALDLSTLTDKQIAEMQNFYSECAGDYTMSRGYDCECLSAKYMEKRLEMGDMVGRDELMLYIEGTCLNAADAAGTTYEECMNMRPVPFMKGTQEEFCECYATNFGKMYGAAEGLNAAQGSALKSRAQVMCMDLPAGVNFDPGIN